MHFSVRPTSVIAQHTPHASSALPQDVPAKQTKSVITLDLWFNRLWQHWKVANEIAFFICIPVFANKSNQGHAYCSFPDVELSKIKLPCSNCIFWRDNHFNFKFCWTYSTSLRQRCPVSILCAVVTVEGSWDGWRRPYCACQSQRGGRKRRCQTTCQALMLQRTEELN